MLEKENKGKKMRNLKIKVECRKMARYTTFHSLLYRTTFDANKFYQEFGLKSHHQQTNDFVLKEQRLPGTSYFLKPCKRRTLNTENGFSSNEMKLPPMSQIEFTSSGISQNLIKSIDFLLKQRFKKEFSSCSSFHY